MAEENKKFKKKILFKIIQIIIVLILSTAISYLFIQKTKKEGKDLINKRLTAKNVAAKYEARIRLANEYKIVEPYLDQISNFLLKEEDVPEIISSLEKLAQDTGNQSSIKTKSETSYKFSGSEAEKIDYMVTLSGDYDTFLSYCKNFKSLPYFSKMEYINISGALDLDKNSQMVCGVSFFIEKPIKK